MASKAKLYIYIRECAGEQTWLKVKLSNANIFLREKRGKFEMDIENNFVNK